MVQDGVGRGKLAEECSVGRGRMWYDGSRIQSYLILPPAYTVFYCQPTTS